MTKYRNLTVVSEILQKQKFMETLNNYEYVAISGKRPKTDTRGEAVAKIVMLAPGTKFAKKSADFKKLLKTLMKSSDCTEIMFVSEDPLTISIKKYLDDEFHNDYIGIYAEHYDYGIFMIETPAHSQVDRHEILSASAAEDFLWEYYIQKKDLAHILTGDPQAVWLGMRAGMVCKIVRVSETAGSAEVYKVCVNGPLR